METNLFCALDLKGDGLTTVFVVSKSQWEKENWINNEHATEYVSKTLEKYDFGEAMESEFQGIMPPCEIIYQLSKERGFEYSHEVFEFCQQFMKNPPKMATPPIAKKKKVNVWKKNKKR